MFKWVEQDCDRYIGIYKWQQSTAGYLKKGSLSESALWSKNVSLWSFLAEVSRVWLTGMLCHIVWVRSYAVWVWAEHCWPFSDLLTHVFRRKRHCLRQICSSAKKVSQARVSCLSKYCAAKWQRRGCAFSCRPANLSFLWFLYSSCSEKLGSKTLSRAWWIVLSGARYKQH